MSTQPARRFECLMFVIIVGLLANTIGGAIWLVKFRTEHEEYLKTRYYVESIILLSIPIAIACFFVIIFIVVVTLLFIEHGRSRRMARLEEEGVYDIEMMDEIAESYLKMLEEVNY